MLVYLARCLVRYRCGIATLSIAPRGRSGDDFSPKSPAKLLSGLGAFEAPAPEFFLVKRLRSASALLVLAVAVPGVDGLKFGSKATIGHRDLNNEGKVAFVDIRGDISLA